jgi:hypothetical protein
VQNTTENDRVVFWLMAYAALSVSVFVFAVLGRFAP